MITRDTYAPSNAERLAVFRYHFALSAQPTGNAHFRFPQDDSPALPRPRRPGMPKSRILP